MRSIWRKLFNSLPDEYKTLLSTRLERFRFVNKLGMKYFKMSQFKSVQGFLHDQEAKLLFDLTLDIDSPFPRVLEIGSWLGKSAVVFGAALKIKGAGVLNCVDPFDATGDARSEERYKKDASLLKNELYKKFLSNIDGCGVKDYIAIHVGTSEKIVRGWSDQLDLLFIDGDHSYEAVCSDFAHWSPHLREGGILCFHDTWLEPPEGNGRYHAGPGECVKSKVIGNKSWRLVAYVNSLYCVQKIS